MTNLTGKPFATDAYIIKLSTPGKRHWKLISSTMGYKLWCIIQTNA
jgi:hypothetical protein